MLACLLILFSLLGCRSSETDSPVPGAYVEVPSSSFTFRLPQDYQVVDLDGILYLEKVPKNSSAPSLRLFGSAFEEGQQAQEWIDQQVAERGWSTSQDLKVDGLEGKVFFYEVSKTDSITRRVATLTAEREGVVIVAVFLPEKEPEAEALFEAIIDSLRYQ